MDGKVYVLDRASGDVRQYYVGSPMSRSPVGGRRRLLRRVERALYALDLRTHRNALDASLGAKITSSAAIAGGHVVQRRLRRPE